MSISLFEHNKQAYDAVEEMLSETGRAAVIHPTGTGKSFIGFKLCEAHPDKCVCWLSPSSYIFKTQLENLARVSSGYQPKNVKFFTYAKLAALDKEELETIHPDYIILDEFHRCGAQKWGSGVASLLSHYKDVPIVGLSATNVRYLDNQRDMAVELFGGNIASEMTLGEAIVRGILSSPTYILSVFSYSKDLERYKNKIKRAKNRVVRDEAEIYYEALRRALEKADGLDDVFSKHIKSRNGKFIVFCADAEHMQEMIKNVPLWFGKIDVAPHVYSAYSDDPATSKAFADFKADQSEHLKLLFCIDMLNEGVHIEKIDGVILFRPTISPIIYKQQIGRALSASKDKDPIIFDIVNNLQNLYSIGTIEQEMQIAANYYRFMGMENEIVNERFKIIDEVQDVRRIFEQLNDSLSASWDMMYEFAKQYYAEHGDLEVPKRYKTADGYSLGHWIFTQRKVYKGEAYGNLGKDRIEKLEAVGMVWNSVRDVSWQRYYAAAKAYYEKHGDLNVPANYRGANGEDLSAWIRRMRMYRKSGIQSSYLLEERIEMLDRIGMVWNIPDYLWEENFSGAVQFYREHGHLDIPADYCTPDGLKIGTWVRRQRALRSGKLTTGVPPTESQVARLDEIGMIWKTSRETSWEAGYQSAVEYHNRYGNLCVPTNYIAPDGYKLGSWISDRRERGKKQHSEEQQRLLDEMGMLWEKPDSWEVRYALAKQYYEEHGGLNIPAKYKVDGIWLAKWVNEQRQCYIGNRGEKRLTSNQIDRLEQIGMVWENCGQLLRDNAWHSQFEKVKAFYCEHGHLNIPDDYSNGSGKSLHLWLNRQRKLKSTSSLEKEQIALLEDVGMDWLTPSEREWELHFEAAQRYYDRNGTLDIPCTYVDESGFSLGMWMWRIRTQKVRLKTSGANGNQVERLQKIGFVFSSV